MAVKVLTFRAYLIADSADRPFAVPREIDLGKEVIPYGARVRFEAEIEADETICLPWLQIYNDSDGWHRPMFAKPDGRTYWSEARLPWELLWGGRELHLLSAPPVFPVFDWPDFPGGEYHLQIAAQSADSPAREAMPLLETSFRLDSPQNKVGRGPKMGAVEGFPGSPHRLGQPWLSRVAVTATDNPIGAVVFCVYRAGAARWGFMGDDGRSGDELAGDGIYSHLRVTGDWWERAEFGKLGFPTVTLSVQAVDICGNWSEPSILEYDLDFDSPPLWTAEPDPDGPSILEAEVNRAEGVLASPLLRARCDSPDAWVCARVVIQPDYLQALFDDGGGADFQAGDGIHADLLGLPASHFWDVVFYAVPKTGPFRAGRKMAAVCPPFGQCTVDSSISIGE
jgi:hypothetical protein